MGFVVGSWPENWHRSRLFRVLSLGGYVAFDLPRVVTGLGAALLAGIAATHGYLMYSMATQDALPAAFVGYAVAVIAACLLVAAGMGVGRNPAVAQASWYFGSLLSVVVLGVDVATRITSLPGLTAVTGRWDVAPATFALAFAGAYIGVHASVLLGINVAHPRRQQWED
ncbi:MULTISPECIES: oxidoreductase [unclassified Mycobacterium]|uniref:oxidoreductase n=1 Tax=unclassified Mycobacterium TaxID=2642494 RepID=UPI000801738F|nr:MULTISPECIES: oxidoreductase [unclassified Mycobacterium]OBH00378.1 oxidoreductase [Mycobacterium sp. E2699]OBI51183.1 oxidoreductase [Mycobacterium sp. E787]